MTAKNLYESINTHVDLRNNFLFKYAGAVGSQEQKCCFCKTVLEVSNMKKKRQRLHEENAEKTKSVLNVFCIETYQYLIPLPLLHVATLKYSLAKQHFFLAMHCSSAKIESYCIAKYFKAHYFHE